MTQQSEHAPDRPTEAIDADEIAEMADCRQDISAHFTNQFTVVRPAIQQFDVDIAAPTRTGS